MRSGTVWIVTMALLAAHPNLLRAQTVLNAFEGSVEKGVFETEFESFSYAESSDSDPAVNRVEGSITSRVLLKPEGKSNLEVFRSYEQELQAAGFTILVAATPANGPPQNLVRVLYRSPRNDLAARVYRATEDTVLGNDLNRLATFGEYYLAASRTQGDTTLYVGLVLCRDRNLYLIDELTTAAMETGTVTLNLELMRSEMQENGKIAVYDLYFATGSAEIEPASADALTVIASYLSEAAGGFYIVGHTDDAGTLAGNLSLSERRSAAVKEALVTGFDIAGDRLETRGVGPLVPVSTNTAESGRALNRRVEIVQRLED